MKWPSRSFSMRFLATKKSALSRPQHVRNSRRRAIMATAPAKILEPSKIQEPIPAVGEGEKPGSSPSRRSKTRMRWLIGLVALVVAAAGVMLYRYFAAWESTDDAQID